MAYLLSQLGIAMYVPVWQGTVCAGACKKQQEYLRHSRYTADIWYAHLCSAIQHMAIWHVTLAVMHSASHNHQHVFSSQVLSDCDLQHQLQ